MKPLLIALVALAAAVIAGHFVADDPGFIVIGYGGKVVRTTFAFFMVVLLVGFVALYALLAFFRNLRELRGRWRRWSEDNRRRRAHDSLANGLMAMAAGDFAGAEKLFRRGVDDDARADVHYLAAATAAEAQRASARRDNYLQLAIDNNPDSRPTLNLKRAEWLLDRGELSEAAPLVERLTATEIGNPQVLRLKMRLARARNDHAALLALVPDLRRDHVVSADEAAAIERHAAASLLALEHGGRETLNAHWNGFGKHLKASTEVLGAYARALCRVGAVDEAEALIRKRVERQWHSELVALYGEIPCDPPAKQLRKLEAWAMNRGDDPGLRLARARQAIRAGRWPLARTQLEALMAVAPSPLLHQLLAQIADGSGDAEAADAHRRLGLELATGEQVAARLPPPQPATTSAA